MSAKKITRGSDFRFTPESIEALPIPTAGRDFYRDAETDGLYLVVRPNGKKIFTWYRKVQGRPWSEKLGTWPHKTIKLAQADADERNGKLERWKADEYSETSVSRLTRKEKRKPAKEYTLGALLDDYVERRIKKNNKKNPIQAIRNLRRAYELYCHSWMAKPCSRITEEDVARLHNDLSKKSGEITANRQVARLRTLFNFGRITKLYTGDNPVVFARKVGDPGIEKNHEDPRTRTLDAEERERMWKALAASPNRDFRHYITISYYTAARKGDVLSMRWADLDLARATWLVPTPKSKRPYMIPLADEVVRCLNERAEKRSDWVFPSSGATGHIVSYKKPWEALLKAAGLDYPNGERVRPRLHDIRRTFATVMLNNGTPMSTVSRFLGHSNPAITAKAYAHVSDQNIARAVREAAAVGRKALPIG